MLAPTPFIIGLTSDFTIQKKLRKLPNEIWEVEIDSAIINPPTGMTVEDLPSFPEPEGKILRYHLKQVCHLSLISGVYVIMGVIYMYWGAIHGNINFRF